MKTLYLVAIFAALGGLLSGFDTGVISGALLYIDNDWNLNEFMQGFLVSIVLIGAALGALLNGRLADIYGRKSVIFITALLFFTGSILSAIAPDIYLLVISRFIVGFAIGMITFCAPIYLSEISPEKIRGALVSMFQLAITFGILVSYISNAFFAHFYESWRPMLLFGAIPAFILAVGILYMPDTPRFYILSGQIAKARETILKLYPNIDPYFEIETIKSLIFKGGKKCKFKFEKWMLFPLLIGIGGMFIQQWTGINTIIYYAPVILKNAGFGSDFGAICATIGIGVVNFGTTLCTMFLIDKIGRKPLLYQGLFGMGGCMCLLGFLFKNPEFFGTDTKYLIFACIMYYIIFFAASLGPVMILLVSEVFPLQARGVMMSISMMSNFVFNFTVSVLFLPLVKVFGEFNMFILFALLSFLSIIFVKYIIPETKGQTLENIEKNWKNYA